MQQTANVQVLFQQARKAYTARRLDEALQLSNRMISLAGEREEILNLKALTLLALDRPLEAKAVIDRALKTNPRSAGMHLNAARIELLLADRRAAKRHVREAAKLNPNDAPTLYQAAILSRQCGDYALAMRLVERCQSRAPQLPEARHLKGSMLLDQGDLEAAVTEFESALQVQPGHARALADLVRIKGQADGQPELQERLEQVARHGRDPWDRSTALFAWADLLHRQGNHEAAAERYQEANAQGTTVRPFDMAAWETKQERTLAKYADLDPLGPPGEGAGANLVFLVGMPRSGTSLTEQVIGAHPDALPCGELTAMHAIELYRPDDEDDSDARRRFLDALPPEHVNKALVTDKLPMNFERVGMIHRLFPGARFVHCRRHPLDTILSCYQQDFQAGVQWAFDLDRIARVYLAQKRLMAHWSSRIPAHVHAIDYEALVTDLDSAVDDIAGFLDVSAHPAMRTPHRSAGTVQTASRIQVREAVYTHSVGKWRPYEAMLTPAIERLQGTGAHDAAAVA